MKVANRTDYQINLLGKADELVKALDQASQALKKTQAASSETKVSFETVAATAAVAFASIKVAISDSVHAFFEAERASRQLDQALRENSVSKYREEYGKLADELTDLIGIDDDAAIAAFAQGQAMLGNVKITKELTTAVANFASLKGQEFADVFDKVTKTVGTSTNALKKLGIEVDNGGTKQQRLAEVIEALNGKARGQAEASQTGEVAFKRLGVAVGNLKEEIGKNLAPTLIEASNAMTKFFKEFKNNEDLVKTVSYLAATAAGILALVAAGNTGFYIIGQLTTAMTALDAVLLANPVGAFIAGIVALGAVIYTFQNEILASFQAYFKGFLVFMTEAGTGIASIVNGILRLDPAAVAEGASQLKDAVNKSIDAAKATYVSRLTELNAEKNKLITPSTSSDQPSSGAKRVERELVIAENQLIKLELDRAAKEVIELKKSEIGILKQLDEEHNNSRRELLKQQLEDNRKEQERARNEDLENRNLYFSNVLSQDRDYQALSSEQQAEFLRQYQAQLVTSQQSEDQIRLKTIFDKQKSDTDANNAFVKDKQKYGVLIAAINKTINSDEVKQFRESSSDMVQLSQSKNATLKTIGKAYALSNIAISTAEMAVKAFNSLAGIPLIGPVLGAAAAAAAVAFGAERTADVIAANAGGIVPGGGANQDSVKAYLTPGELVVPRQNFDEVVSAVASQRSGGAQGTEVLAAKMDQMISLMGQSVIVEVKSGSTDPLTTLFDALNYRLEFQNLRLYGVNV
jgi:hypothetical protein